MSVLAIELEGIRKRFGPVVAVAGADLRVQRGSVHAVVGENGAGKSTLMKIAFGMVRADAGTMKLAGESVDLKKHEPADAIAHRVGMVHQHFMLVPTLTVAENLVLGAEPVRGPLLDVAAAEARVIALAGRLGIDVDPRARVEDLSVGEQQRVEILRVLYRDAELLILDEPTAVLTPAEVRELFALIRSLVSSGATVVMVTHKLDEVMDIADRVTVMRAGTVVTTLEREQLSAEALAQAMVGRPVLLEVERPPPGVGDLVLDVTGLLVSGHGGRRGVKDVSLRLHAGEVLGIAGVEGNGQEELILALAGVISTRAGIVKLGKQTITGASARRRQRLGIGHIPADRHARGLILDFDLSENVMLGQQRQYTRASGVIARKRLESRTATLLEAFDVRPRDPHALARSLSGGNQQKLVVARELARIKLSVLLCAHPTRGVDVGAIELIHQQILDARACGVAVLLVSSELAELRALSDRVLVLYRGRVAGEVDAAQLSEQAGIERVGRLMTGAPADLEEDEEDVA
jgi:simple sugar transport system ATP-binding protein